MPRIASLTIVSTQPQEEDPATIWFDDFDGAGKQYSEESGPPLDSRTKFGDFGQSLRCDYPKDSQGEGNRKVFFGDSPVPPIARVGEKFDEIYWRLYVKHQDGWTGGGPAKLSRATSIVSGGWLQAMISHVWSSGESLTLDPASGVVGDRVVTTTYNDFANLHWLGNQPVTETKVSSTDESGWFVCVEARAKLNTPGLKDGVNQLWIDGKLESERTGMAWRGSYTAFGINAVFLEAYWNSNSPVTESRWYDNFIISTQPIGTVVCPRNPKIYKSLYRGPESQAAWEVEIAMDRQGQRVVWRSKPVTNGDSILVDGTNGTFVGRLAGKNQLAPGSKHYFRVRQQSTAGVWSDWSRWHQEFLTEGQADPTSLGCDYDGNGRANVIDVIGLLLHQRRYPGEAGGDYDGDGKADLEDVTALLADILQDRCGIEYGGLAASSPLEAAGALEGLSPADRAWLEETIVKLPLPEDQARLLEQALKSPPGTPGLPEQFSLSQNTPNPFNPQTAIKYSLPASAGGQYVTLRIYDLRNRLVRTLVDGERPAGTYTVFWDGTDNDERPVANGVYLYRLQAGDFSQMRKMVILR
ncbi:MAG: FlgD immunoglobulin-like domain containing protein [Candidatus Glassbacteria bacterium]